jgi:flagellar biosynthesis/type III secretory pathway protein FliH
MSDRPQPLFASLVAGSRPFAQALTTQGTPGPVTSWLPQHQSHVVDEAALAVRTEELAELRAKAIEDGRTEGLRETAILRDTLKQLAVALATARDGRMDHAAEAIADCALAAIEGWIGATPAQDLFAPAIRGWMTRSNGAAATAKVHPSQVAALQAAIGDAPITVEADPTIAPNDLKIRGEALDQTHVWGERLRELRDAIATALETA